jgi:murein tripeptide amidase MpaA
LGAPIIAFEIGTGTKSIVRNGGVHAREWMSPMAVTYIAAYLAGDSADAILMRSKFKFHIIPVLNVDGYEYSRSTKRLWRKNRQTNVGSKLDLNRNFEFKWGFVGVSTDPCSSVYMGVNFNSAPETAALDEYVGQISQKIVNFIDFHTYGNQFLYTPGWICGVQDEYETDFQNALKILTDGVRTKTGDTYVYGPGCTLYAVSGTTDDHMHEMHDVKYSFHF